MLALMHAFAKEETGATAIEYGLIAGLVSVAGITALEALGVSLVGTFNRISSGIDAGTAGAAGN